MLPQVTLKVICQADTLRITSAQTTRMTKRGWIASNPRPVACEVKATDPRPHHPPYPGQTGLALADDEKGFDIIETPAG
jgi:hypothetical protein